MINILNCYYLFVFIIVGICGTLIILDRLFDENLRFIDGKINYLKVIFMYQYAVYELSKDYLNKAGIIVLEVFTTFSVWFLNIFMVFIVCGVNLLFAFCKLFYFIFKKR